jgi:hypothetical protein
MAAQLQALKTSHSAQLNETLRERLNHYRLVAERFLDDDEKALAALDRCFKQADIEARLTGECQKKQEPAPPSETTRNCCGSLPARL